MTPSAAEIDAYDTHGVVVLRGLFLDWLAPLRSAVDQVLQHPGPLGRDAVNPGGTGRFFQERALWTWRPAFHGFVMASPAASLAGQLMRSDYALLYSDHLFVKEPGTLVATPWHQDISYFNIDGWKQCSIWVALDHTTPDSSGLEFVSGSHRWPDIFAASDFSNRGGSFVNTGMKPLPDIQSFRDAGQVIGFELDPGDCLAFHHRILHGASGNASATRRRALSTRWAGDDVVYRPTANTIGHGSGLNAGHTIESPQHPRLWERPHRSACDEQTVALSGQFHQPRLRNH